ncbi:hypothetical protein BC939DRAFT_507513 [Gamsiella multidivaricata]|uniref:uncharacterized protein n=1 Tax=Gamsiella multidivaricata TaxID=101098 RepID=UPI00221F4770|nr:uncharacterized protein BC939DRAFT_507513 [Gamsiella multidivaricata]KAI7817331.1 hypothetical protein BC939DRAFT_507513 [Gamsiella multidivaricata]
MGQISSTPSRSSRPSRSQSQSQSQLQSQSRVGGHHLAPATVAATATADRTTTLPLPRLASTPGTSTSSLSPPLPPGTSTPTPTHPPPSVNTSPVHSHFHPHSHSHGQPCILDHNHSHMLQSTPQPLVSASQRSAQQAQTPSSSTPAQTPSSTTATTAAASARPRHSSTRGRRIRAAFNFLLFRNSNTNTNTGRNRGANRSTNRSTSGNNIHNNSGITGQDRNTDDAAPSARTAPTVNDSSNISNGSSSISTVISSAPEYRLTGLSARLVQPERSGLPTSSRPTSTRPQTPQRIPYPSTSSTRTPRGVSHMQRRHDEQSIRSFRSTSSRSSGVLATHSSSSTAAPLAGQFQPHLRQYSPHPNGHLSTEQDQDSTRRSFALQALPSHPFTAHDIQTNHSASSQMITVESLETRNINAVDLGLDASPFVGHSNPRGGTSISSSLLPIRPESEDEDDDSLAASDVHNQHRVVDQEQALEHGLISPSSDTNTVFARHRSDTEQSQGHMNAGVRERAGERPRASRPSRYPPPELIADVIRGQIAQGIAETEANRPPPLTEHRYPMPSSLTTPMETLRSSTTRTNLNDGTIALESSTYGPRLDAGSGGDSTTHRSAAIHGRRSRSSSLRGLLGYPTMGTSGTSVRGTGIDRGFTPVRHDQRARLEETVDQRRFVENQLPFFTRLLMEIGRSLRGGQGHSTEGDRDSPTRSTSSPAFTSTTEGSTIPSSGSGFGLHSSINDASVSDSALPRSRPTLASGTLDQRSAPSRPRRHTTIRFIQIGGGTSLAAFSATRPRSGSVGSGQVSSRSETPDHATRVGHEELADAILMFLSSPASGNGSDAEPSETTSQDGGETPRTRPRRSPWVVFTLSGAYLSSLLAGAAEDGDDEGLSYDDLWMLSNMIGPARPTTTTQEAIDNAGFHVGQFEDAAQGMRDFDMLGDGSKCLICMSDYEEGEGMRALRCKHGFHQECIDKWLTTGANKCPVCRAAAVVPSDTALPAPLSTEE